MKRGTDAADPVNSDSAKTRTAEMCFRHSSSPSRAAAPVSTEALMIEINGVANVILSVSEWDECRTFYQTLLPYSAGRF